VIAVNQRPVLSLAARLASRVATKSLSWSLKFVARLPEHRHAAANLAALVPGLSLAANKVLAHFCYSLFLLVAEARLFDGDSISAAKDHCDYQRNMWRSVLVDG